LPSDAGLPSSFPRSPSADVVEPYPVAPAAVPPRRRRRHILLFVATVLTTTLVGADHYAGYLLDFGAKPLAIGRLDLLLRGLWYSVTILAILGAHELGHYYACRYYRIDVSPPYFLPAPPGMLFGTFGAFIRIRQPIPFKAMLFDIGVAGPIAGFVVAVPALFIGLMMSRMTALPPNFVGLSLGEPLLFQFATWLIWGATPAGHSVNLHPVGFAAWFGLLATALNLFPIGQLDGGHIAYAVLGRRSTAVTVATVGAAVVLTFFSISWLVWTVLMIAMLLSFGARHPFTVDEHVPLDRRRKLVALFALLMFALCFTPAPIEPFELLQQR